VSPGCYHCGLPVAGAGSWRAPVLGAQRDFCCAGCLAVASTIVAAGHAQYYETREQAGRKPDSLPDALAFDDPQAQEQFSASNGPNRRSATLILDGIRCAACLWLNEKTLRGLPGVLSADVNYGTRRAQVAWDPARTRLSAIIEAIRAIGYDAFPYDPQRQIALDRDARRKALWQLFVAGFGAMQVMMYAFPAYVDDGAGTLSREAEQLMRWASLLLTLPVIVFSCGPFFSGAWRELKRLRPGMDTPIALGIGAGFAASAWATVTGAGTVYFDSIAMLAFLLLGARYLELAARQRAAIALDRLARWAPSMALRLENNSVKQVQAHELAKGDQVLVPAGDRIPADGVVDRGNSSTDESLLTGEPVPLAKGPGDALIAGTLNLEQPLLMRVERAGAQTRAAALARLVELAAASRPRLVAAADRLAHFLTWVVLVVAALAGLHSGNLWVAIAVLVATCPCGTGQDWHADKRPLPDRQCTAGGRHGRGAMHGTCPCPGVFQSSPACARVRRGRFCGGGRNQERSGPWRGGARCRPGRAHRHAGVLPRTDRVSATERGRKCVVHHGIPRRRARLARRILSRGRPASRRGGADRVAASRGIANAPGKRRPSGCRRRYRCAPGHRKCHGRCSAA